MQLSGLFNSGLPVKVVGTLILGSVVYVSFVYLNRKWGKRTPQTTPQITPQTTPAPIQMTNIGDNIEYNSEENTETPVGENTTPDNNEDSDTGGNTY